jgi:homeobox-leucine zipper protein
VVSLTEKLQEKEEVEGGGGAAAEFTAADVKQPSQLAVDPEESATAFEEQQVKSEDRLSTGSGGSTVVDKDAQVLGAGGGLAAVDSSVESYFPGGDDHYNDCGMGPVGHHFAAEFQSEEDDGAGSDEGCSYYVDDAAVAAAALFVGHAPYHHEDDGHINWWMWN